MGGFCFQKKVTGYHLVFFSVAAYINLFNGLQQEISEQIESTFFPLGAETIHIITSRAMLVA